jgi:hypothetical protein
MSSTIIPGVSEQLAYEYLDSFNDEKIKYMFIVICLTCEKKNTRFTTCREAYDFRLLHDQGFNTEHNHIYLHQVDGKLTRLSEEEILSLVVFETDDQLYEMFKIYAEKMSRPGRVHFLDQKFCDAWNSYQECNEDEEYDIDDWDGDAEEADECENIKTDIMDSNTKLEYDLFEAEHEVAKVSMELEKTKQQLKAANKARRDIAMDWINSMDFVEFEQRLLSDNLPCFPRAEYDDEDFKEPMAPDRQTCIEIKRTPLTYQDIDANADNYASIYRWKLRCMSVDEFKEMAYYDDIH